MRVLAYPWRLAENLHLYREHYARLYDRFASKTRVEAFASRLSIPVSAIRLCHIQRLSRRDQFHPITLEEYAKSLAELTAGNITPEDHRCVIICSATGMTPAHLREFHQRRLRRLYLRVLRCSPELILPSRARVKLRCDKRTIRSRDEREEANSLLARARRELQRCDFDRYVKHVIVTADPTRTTRRLVGRKRHVQMSHRQLSQGAESPFVRYLCFLRRGPLKELMDPISKDYFLITLPKVPLSESELNVYARAFADDLLQAVIVRCRFHYNFEAIVSSITNALLLVYGFEEQNINSCCNLVHELTVGLLLAQRWPPKPGTVREVVERVIAEKRVHVPHQERVQLPRPELVRLAVYELLFLAVWSDKEGKPFPNDLVPLLADALSAPLQELEKGITEFRRSFRALNQFRFTTSDVCHCIQNLNFCLPLLRALRWEEFGVRRG